MEIEVGINVDFGKIEALFRENFAGLPSLGQSQSDGLSLLVTNDANGNRSTGVLRLQGVAEVSRIMNRFLPHFHDDIARAKARLLSPAAFFDRAHQNAVPVARSEVVAQLRG